MIEQITNTNLLELEKSIAPLNVTVELHNDNSFYTVFFDGRNTYDNPEKWLGTWGGFDKYVELLLHVNKICYLEIESVEDNYVAVKIGTLFDMIKQMSPKIDD